ncbi:hypothetical protein BKI52_17425 [marine bacterium AO1-C]|nr:hypothetical protein BKI52_17425 [marine bacterium AO1-C]
MDMKSIDKFTSQVLNKSEKQAILGGGYTVFTEEGTMLGYNPFTHESWIHQGVYWVKLYDNGKMEYVDRNGNPLLCAPVENPVSR